MKLYRATVEIDVYVWSDGGGREYGDAERAARDALESGGGLHASGPGVVAVTHDESPPREWADSIPWNGVDDRTVNEIVGELRRAEAERVRAVECEAAQGKLPGAT